MVKYEVKIKGFITMSDAIRLKYALVNMGYDINQISIHTHRKEE